MQDETGQARLVYLVSWLAASKEPSRPFVMIDAQTGSELQTLGGSTTTLPARGQRQDRQVFLRRRLWPLQVDDNCRMTGTNVDTLNMNHGTTGAPSTSSPAREHGQGDQRCLFPLNDAHYFGNVVFDMYRNWYNTAPPLSFKLKMRVRHSRNYENAFWDGSQMTFGDGATTFYPLGESGRGRPTR